MSQVFLISDTHFFHQRIIEFSRPQFKTVEEMNETIVENWNKVVTKRDTVWLLGDVCFGPASNLQLLDRLAGTKNLIMGNHDQHGIMTYVPYFNKIEAAKKYDGYLLTHVPIHPSQFYRFLGNVHGHLHADVVLLPTLKPDTRYMNVSCEQVGFTPIAWNTVKERFK